MSLDTKEKILDTAEKLFGEQGYGATSLRQIIAEAGVNLAAVHYHFGSKEELLDAVVVRKLSPINEERLALLDGAMADAGGITIESCLEAFLRPAIMRASKDAPFCKLMGRLLGERLMELMVVKHFQHVAPRFIEALHRALPDLPDEELAWRVHFLIGAMAHTLHGPPETPGLPTPITDPELLLRRIVTFLSAGFQAPVTVERAIEVTQ